ncbi:LamG-like jellyroll fold domain-containing protein [Streptomyces sp. NPDC056672]|uniref:LamG-like jellyroll fold domain-containing protein n=1 Tax=Streptomyces sp. NPDC056672 TaxID=3345906 RepID=UPI0036BD7121
MYCQPYDVKRLFYQISTTKFAGRSILSAEFVVRETHAASCDAREVQLWRTKGINSSTTWNTQIADGFWADHLQTRSFAYGYDGCASKDAEFDVEAVVAEAASKKWPTITFGMRATNEEDPYTWKRFSDSAYLRVNYNRPPSQIKTSQLTMDFGGTCVKADKMPRVRSLPTLRVDNVTDPDGDRVSVQFQALWDTGDGRKPHWKPARTTSKPSGSDFSLKLPTSLPKNKTVVWHARSWDGAQWSPWSSVNANGCYVMYDTSVPAGPSITSALYPASDAEDPDDPWWDGVGRYGAFTIDSSSSDVGTYWFGINELPSSKHTLTTSGGAAKTTKFTPAKPGLNFITAQAFDAAGNGSEIRTYYFRVRAGQPDRLTWGLDEGAGVNAVSGSGGAWPAELHGGATPGGEGVTGGGLRFDGVDDRAATLSPVLNTRKSFSVSLWAKLGDLDPSHGAVALAQAGNVRSGFELYFSPSRSGWVFVRHSADAEDATASRAMQPACATGDTACTSSRLGTWTHVVGVFDNPNSQVQLYVNGTLAGTAPFSGPWDARGGTLLGATESSRTPNGFFSGDLDEAQLFDYQLTAADVTRLHGKQPVDSGTRPAKLVWPMDETADASAVTGRAQQVRATVHGGAQFGGRGVAGTSLHLDGDDDYATTAQPVLDTFQSFSVSLWARLPANKENRAMTAITQADSNSAGFALYHSSALGGWVFAREESNSTTSTVVRAEQSACPAETPNCAAAQLGQWAHVVGVYDYDAEQIRLYVNGVLKDTGEFTTPWLAIGPVTLGHTLASTGPSGLFEGDLDDVQLYDRTVSDHEVRQLFKQNPVVKSRWKFEQTTGTPPVTPDASGEGNGLTLYGGARTAPGGVDGSLELDGVNDYGATATVPVDTSASFTVSAFAQSAGVPEVPVTLLSAPGVKQNALAVRYVPSTTPGTDPGRWQITTADKDSTDASVTQVRNGQFFGPQERNHLALVYDGFASELRLYVNGQLETTACADTDGDGEPDEADCLDQTSQAEGVVTFKAAQGLELGRGRAGSAGTEYWPGSVTDVWTFQGALTEAQIGGLAIGQPGLDTVVPNG